jgi:hypothetical protein
MFDGIYLDFTGIYWFLMVIFDGICLDLLIFDGICLDLVI